jgi:23S rRNA pseudouridine955/2504/2580 synthase
MTGVQILDVAPEDEGSRLDRWIHRLYPHITQGQLQKYLRTGQIRADGKRVEASFRLTGTEKIRLPPLPAPTDAPRLKKTFALSDKDAEALRKTVLYKDEWVIVIDKPAGLAVQGGTKTDVHLDAMLEALAYGGERPKLVHRLDKDTSGVLVLARTRQAAQRLTASFRDHGGVRKYYWAITIGLPQPFQGKIDAPLAKLGGHGRRGMEKMRISEEHGDKAVTLYQVVDHAVKAAWVALWPLTGRTHQLRAHLELIGAPILGDEKYQAKTEMEFADLDNPRLHLHARRLIIPHPRGTGFIDVVAPLPAELKKTWAYFGFGTSDGDPFAGFKTDL